MPRKTVEVKVEKCLKCGKDIKFNKWVQEDPDPLHFTLLLNKVEVGRAEKITAEKQLFCCIDCWKKAVAALSC